MFLYSQSSKPVFFTVQSRNEMFKHWEDKGTAIRIILYFDDLNSCMCQNCSLKTILQPELLEQFW